MFNDSPCPAPCQRFIEGAKDDAHGAVRCAKCGGWFLDDDLDGEGGAQDPGGG